MYAEIDTLASALTFFAFTSLEDLSRITLERFPSFDERLATAQ